MNAQITDADRALLDVITGGSFEFRPKAKRERLAAIAAFRVAAQERMDEIAALHLIARRIIEWVRAVDDLDDDMDYLNGPDGWNDIRETAAMAQAALAAHPGAPA